MAAYVRYEHNGEVRYGEDKDGMIHPLSGEFPSFSVSDDAPVAKDSVNLLAPVVPGKIVAIGLSNELQDQHYVVVDGTDGKLHYAEVGRLSRFPYGCRLGPLP